jgi:hypothetical protein
MLTNSGKAVATTVSRVVLESVVGEFGRSDGIVVEKSVDRQPNRASGKLSSIDQRCNAATTIVGVLVDADPSSISRMSSGLEMFSLV